MGTDPRRFLSLLFGLHLLLAAVAAGGLTALFRTDWYVDHSAYLYDTLVDEHFALHGNADDILVLGDSSALRGVIPAIMERNLGGLTVRNLALFGFSGVESYRLLLRHYLATNQAPKAILLQITATNPYWNAMSFGYERGFTLLRYGTIGDIARYFWIHPQGIHLLLQEAGRVVAGQIARPGTGYHRDLATSLARNKGYNRAKEPPLNDQCDFDTHLDIRAMDYLSDLRNLSAAYGIPLAIYVAPMPECEARYDDYVASYRGIADNRPERLPNRYFVDFTHMSREGAEAHSAELGKFMSDFLARHPASGHE